MLPTIHGDTLFGFVANLWTNSNADCGTCYEVSSLSPVVPCVRGAADSHATLPLQILLGSDSPGPNPNISKLAVQITNKGGMGGQDLDLLVPGGGFGANDGCDAVPGWTTDSACSPWSDTDKCAVFGGLYDSSDCATIFPTDAEAQTSCEEVLFNSVFPLSDGEPPYYPQSAQVTARRRISCPAYLSRLSGLDGRNHDPWQ